MSAVCNQGRELPDLQLANGAAASPALQPLENIGGMSAADKVQITNATRPIFLENSLFQVYSNDTVLY
jgi:hypothetical protein